MMMFIPGGTDRIERWRGVLALTLVALSAVMGCDEFGPRVYTAQAYQVEAACLDTYAPLGLVEAQDIGSQCDAVCLRLDDTLYVSTVCPPYPAETSLEAPEGSADCAAALAALDAETYCEDLGTEPDAGAP